MLLTCNLTQESRIIGELRRGANDASSMPDSAKKRRLLHRLSRIRRRRLGGCVDLVLCLYLAEPELGRSVYQTDGYIILPDSGCDLARRTSSPKCTTRSLPIFCVTPTSSSFHISTRNGFDSIARHGELSTISTTHFSASVSYTKSKNKARYETRVQSNNRTTICPWECCSRILQSTLGFC
jgi:hypothetical protein